MALWLCRAGRDGEHEHKFIDEERIFLTWDRLNVDLKPLSTKESLLDVLRNTYPTAAENTLKQNANQIYAFTHRFEPNDWVGLPGKFSRVIHFGQISSAYTYHADGSDPYFHSRAIKWTHKDVPRSKFDKDILNSFGAFSII